MLHEPGEAEAQACLYQQLKGQRALDPAAGAAVQAFLRSKNLGAGRIHFGRAGAIRKGSQPACRLGIGHGVLYEPGEAEAQACLYQQLKGQRALDPAGWSMIDFRTGDS